jgi:hypothetical protein
LRISASSRVSKSGVTRRRSAAPPPPCYVPGLSRLLAIWVLAMRWYQGWLAGGRGCGMDRILYSQGAPAEPSGDSFEGVPDDESLVGDRGAVLSPPDRAAARAPPAARRHHHRHRKPRAQPAPGSCGAVPAGPVRRRPRESWTTASPPLRDRLLRVVDDMSEVTSRSKRAQATSSRDAAHDSGRGQDASGGAEPLLSWCQTYENG